MPESEDELRQRNTQPSEQAAPYAASAGLSNPWRTGLIAIWVLVLLAGIILLIVGAVLAGSYQPSFGQTDSGTVELALGATFTSTGLTAFLVWIGAEMVLWRAPNVNGQPTGRMMSAVDRANLPER